MLSRFVLALAFAGCGVVTVDALGQDTPAVDLVGAWQSTEGRSLYLFDPAGGYAVIGWKSPVTTGTYEVLTDDDRTIVKLAPDAYVQFSGDDGAAIIWSPGATPEEAAAATDYDTFVHASAADPRPSSEPLAIEGDWIGQDGAGVITFGPGGAGTLLMLGEYLDFSDGRVGTRRPIAYKFQPTEGGGVLSLALDEGRLDFEVAAFGPDVMMIDDLPPDGADLDALRKAGGQSVFMRVVDTH